MTEHQNFNTALLDSSEGEAMGTIEVRSLFDSLPPNSLLAASKHDQSMLVKTIGERMRQARELCNLSQSAAAKQLGYSNPSKLSKVESAIDTNSVPLWLVHAAARLYQVNVGYLFGLNDDWEPEAPRSAQVWLLERWNEMRIRDMSALDRVHAEVVTVAQTTSDLLDGVRRMGDALSAFRTRNGEFDDMPASALLVGRLARLEAVARDAEAKLKKLRLAPKEAA